MALPVRTARLTAAVFAAFGETATLRAAAGGETPGVRVKLRRPTDAAPLWDGAITVASPTVEVPFEDVDRLRQGDILDGIDGRCWKLTEAPTRPGDGRKWLAAVVDAGPAT